MAVAHKDLAMDDTVTSQPTGYRDWLYKKGSDEHPFVSGPPPLAPLFPNAPAGLAHLVDLDTVVIKQVIHLMEVLTGWEIENEYRILNGNGQQFMFCKEESGTCARQCLGESRPFVMNITNNERTDTMIQLHRPYRCVGCLCWCCCMQEMSIECPPGRTIGHIKQVWTACYPRYQITDEEGKPLFFIAADFCCCVCFDDIPFKIYAGDHEGAHIGTLTKHWMGCAELIQVNNFSLTFPRQMPVLHKSLLLGAVFLMDMVYFEYKDNNHKY